MNYRPSIFHTPGPPASDEMTQIKSSSRQSSARSPGSRRSSRLSAPELSVLSNSRVRGSLAPRPAIFSLNDAIGRYPSTSARATPYQVGLALSPQTDADCIRHQSHCRCINCFRATGRAGEASNPAGTDGEACSVVAGPGGRVRTLDARSPGPTPNRPSHANTGIHPRARARARGTTGAYHD